MPWLALRAFVTSAAFLKGAAIVMAIISVYAYIDRKATYRERAKCEAAAVQAQKRADKQDNTAAVQTQQFDQQVLEDMKRTKALDDQEIAALHELIRKQQASAKPGQPACGFILGDDAKWVR